MTSWMRTLDGWAVNLDGTNAARQFTLPRIELHSSVQGWTSVFHFEDGTWRRLSVERASTVVAAKLAAVEEAQLALGPRFHVRLRAVV